MMKERQEPQSRIFYGLSGIGLVKDSQYSVQMTSRRQNDTQYDIQMSALDKTIVNSYTIDVFGVQSACDAMGCQSCDRSPIDCVTCVDVLRDPTNSCLNCNADEYIDYADYHCKACSKFCVGCLNDKANCLACPINSQRVNNVLLKCPCNPHYYDVDDVVCLICDFRCGNCEQTSTNCKTCSGTNRNLNNKCHCKDKFY